MQVSKFDSFQARLNKGFFATATPMELRPAKKALAATETGTSKNGFVNRELASMAFAMIRQSTSDRDDFINSVSKSDKVI